MTFGESALAVGPVFGFAVAVGLFRRSHMMLGGLVAVLCVGIVATAAALGNARPIVGVFASAMLAAAFIADERQRRAVALSCFSVAFLALIVAVMYT